MLQNLKSGKFEKLSFLTGILRGLLDLPAEVSKGIRAGSIFMIPFYVGIMVFVGARQGADWLYEIIGGSTAWLVMATIVLILSGCALMQILVLPFRSTAGHSIFRIAVVNARGELAGISQMLIRWVIVWLPLLLPLSIVFLLFKRGDLTAAFYSALVLITLWLCAAVYAVIHPNRGLHDRLAGTWVVRR